MRVLNIGSLNLYYVYNLDHIVQPGETEASYELNVHLGGKGMNQTVALAKAGVDVYHGGMIGEDGQPFLDACKEFGVHAEYIRQTDTKSGHAIIQIDKNAQNSILLYGGANQQLTSEYIDTVLADFGAEDILLLQNEVNMLPYIVNRAHEKGMTIALNPSPFNEKLHAVDTTAAGDTFTGYFLAGLCEGLPIPEVLKMSAKASSIAVSRAGAVPSIPFREEVMAALV